MLTLRLTQYLESEPDYYRVEITLKHNDLEHKDKQQNAVSYFHFKVKEQDYENIRWYLEDFLDYLQDPAPKIAKNIEQNIDEIGIELFNKVFDANEDTRKIWQEVSNDINDTRVEIVTGVSEAAAIPWELIRDSQSKIPLVLNSRSFVRTNIQEVQSVQISQPVDGKIRILLVICRPRLEEDIPFRSVATKLIKGLTDSGREVFQLEVLRPPTFDQLDKVLQQAQKNNQPYHIVHFDGHGTYQDLNAEKVGKPPRKMRGYLEFENPDYQNNQDLIGGKMLGKLLVENGVSLLVLNACRSAYIEASTEPSKPLANNQINAYGSLAQEVIDAGVAGVVAMRYNVYVFTASQFVADLYAALVQGQSLGEAVTQGRKQLYDQQLREISDKELERLGRRIEYKLQKLEDWIVPLVYESAPIKLFPKSSELPEQLFNIDQNDTMPVGGMLDPQLPETPHTGFFGRDETILKLDRAFDTQSIVLLHGYAGSGKTITAAEFGRWYAQTGGVNGSVLFTSFERHIPLAGVLNKIGQVFEDLLKVKGIEWFSLSEKEKQDKILEVLNEVPVLWIWDNVESVAGFPAGQEFKWSPTEQQELVEFLQQARHTQAKFLLTSRREERQWLIDLPVERIPIPPMPIQERVQFARALIENKQNDCQLPLKDWLNLLPIWLPLLQFSEGNPLTIKVLIGQALHDRLTTKDQVEKFVADLRTGEVELTQDDVKEGRSKSLHASLSYGFTNAFNETERQQLAVLYLFQGFVDEMVFCWMGDSEKAPYLPTLRDLTSEDAKALFKRAADIGLLSKKVSRQDKDNKDNGYFRIHPVLPWYFKRLFERYYERQKKVAFCSFIVAMSRLAALYGAFHQRGYHEKVFERLLDEEANLLYALDLADKNKYWRELSGIMQGLNTLYKYTGRSIDWELLVENIYKKFVDTKTKKPLPGREKVWYFVTKYYADLKRELRQWEEAEYWYQAQVNELSLQAGLALGRQPKTLEPSANHYRNPIKSLWNTISRLLLLDTEQLDTEQCNSLDWLATAFTLLGDVQRAQNKSSCIESYEQAIIFLQLLISHSAKADEHAQARRTVANALLAKTNFDLGIAYLDVPQLYNLEKAEKVLKNSQKKREQEDRIGIGLCESQLGRVKYQHFLKAQSENQPQEEQKKYLEEAKNKCKLALGRLPEEVFQGLPEEAFKERAATFNLLGLIYEAEGNLKKATEAYRDSIRCAEAIEDPYSKALTCYNLALALKRAGLFDEALPYAQTALDNYGQEKYGSTTANIQKTRDLIREIKRDLKAKGG